MQTRPVTDSLLPPERREDSRPSRLSRWARIGPALSFACVELVALPVLMVLGRARWFYNDDWDFLVRRPRDGYGRWCCDTASARLADRGVPHGAARAHLHRLDIPLYSRSPCKAQLRW